jgi:uncharacterized membrane protein (GlpM family)
MRITLNTGRLRAMWPHAYLVRFLFGGLVTALVGVISAVAGPGVGGLFLAFPSIAVASLTLIERDEGKNAVGADAWGASLGSLGLLAFGGVVWFTAPHWPAWQILPVALLAWLSASYALWLAGCRVRHAWRRGSRRQSGGPTRQSQ